MTIVGVTLGHVNAVTDPALVSEMKLGALAPGMMLAVSDLFPTDHHNLNPIQASTLTPLPTTSQIGQISHLT